MNVKKITVSMIMGIFMMQISNAQTPVKSSKVAAKAPQTAAKPAQVVANLPFLKNSLDSLSYAIGLNIGQNFKQQGLKPNLTILSKALDEVLKGEPLLMDNQKANGYIQSYMQNQTMGKANENKKIGDKFLAENKLKAGVISLPSGLQYQVIKEGTGAKPVATDKVKVHYHGTLIDGTVFDSSVQRGAPVEFGVTQVIPGWVEALQLMPIGSKWKLFIPANLAYGAQAPSPTIGPNSTLIFDVELLDIVKEAPVSTGAPK